MEENRTIEVLLKKPNRHPKLVKINNTLEEMQELVGGLIDIVPYNDVFIIKNARAKKHKLKPNVKINEMLIYGSFFIVGNDEIKCDFISLSKEQIKKYKKEITRLRQEEMEM